MSTSVDHDAHPSTPEPGGSKLKQAITGPLLYLFILGDVLGAGIYALMGT
jgi:APA family basic amino acid/polyamine antiporter